MKRPAIPPGPPSSLPPASLTDLYRDIQNELDKVEEKLRFFSSSPNPIIAEVSQYLFQKGGKRIRPALVVLCSKLLDYKGDEHILMSALVEFIHTASLIHDDIIDNSELRRGRESVHTKWGPNITVLLGDYLYIKTINLSLQSSYLKIIRILTDISAKMIEGELTEYYMSGNLDMTEPEYLDIIFKKTASLFSASCQIGGIIGKAKPREEAALKEFGTNLGMTFQITDDLLDFAGDEESLGKPVLSDVSEGRITLPLIYTLKNGRKNSRQHLASLLKKGELKRESKQTILDIVRSNGALEYTFQKAKTYCMKSLDAMSRFPESAHQETLRRLSEFVLNRKN